MGRLDGKVAVVTGGANGIGRACCERFAEEGADVVVADLGDDAGGETVALVEKAGRKAVYVSCDAASAADNAAVMQRAVDEFGGVDILVTAAGITHATYESGNMQKEFEFVGELGDLILGPGPHVRRGADGRLARVLDVNLTGTYLAMRAAVAPDARTGRRIDRDDRIGRVEAARSRTRRVLRVEGRRLDADEAGRTRARGHRASG